MPVIMKDNVQYAYTTKGTVFHTLSNAEYEALTEEEKMNGDVYCIPDREPVINPDQLWEKVGTGTLDIGSDLTDGVNQLNSSIGDWKNITFSGTYSGELDGVYNNKLKLAIVTYNSKTANADYTATMNVTAKKSQFGVIRGGGYLQVFGAGTTISITNSAQWSVGQIIFTIL